MDLGWTTKHTELFLKLQESIINTVKIKFPKDGYITCVFTDASERYWSGVVTQCHPAEIDKTRNGQIHEPLAFLGSAFSSCQLNWSTYEKEGYEIYAKFQKIDYILL